MRAMSLRGFSLTAALGLVAVLVVLLPGPATAARPDLQK
jgi:hypothetical protein